MTPATYRIEKENEQLFVVLEFDNLLKVGQRCEWRLNADAAFYHRDDYPLSIVGERHRAFHKDVCDTLAVACDELMEVYGCEPTAHELPF